jgi:RimJ/RimL family protein N-acetyltransferase
MNSTPFPHLETPRLILREILSEDVPEIYAIHSNAKAMQWFGVDPISSVEQAEQLVKLFADWRSHANPGTRWGLQNKKRRNTHRELWFFSLGQKLEEMQHRFRISPRVLGSWINA